MTELKMSFDCDTMSVDLGDKTPLVVARGDRDRCRASKTSCVFISVFGFILLAALVIAGYVMYWKDVVGLKVMALNTWGMPRTLGSWDKEERMAAIGDHLAKGEYDIILLEELWMRPDHETIKSRLPNTYTMTNYSDLASSSCDGTSTPWGCSGLAVISRIPVEQFEFSPYTVQGDFGRMITDGEYFSGKGVGRVRVIPQPGMSVDIFVTHTIADDQNHEKREKQAEELVEKHIKKSTADFVILGGDFNASPKSKIEQTYQKIRAEMTNSFEELRAKLDDWLNPDYATYGNKRNTYTGDNSEKYTSTPVTPVIYDYIFNKKNTEDPAMIWTNWFELPFLATKRQEDNSTISLSDHEAVTSHLYLWKQR